MGKQHFARFGIDVGGVSLKSRHPYQSAGNHHRNHRGHIAFTTSHKSFAVESCQSDATRIADGCQQVEAANGKSL